MKLVIRKTKRFLRNGLERVPWYPEEDKAKDISNRRHRGKDTTGIRHKS